MMILRFKQPGTWLFLMSMMFAPLQVRAMEKNIHSTKNTSITIQGGGFFIPMGVVSYGWGARYEYAFSPLVSLIVPVDYAFVTASSFAESSKFDTMTAGVGARFYFSQLFWPQKKLRGFFAESRMGLGYVIESPGDDHGIKPEQNAGLAASFSGALGYAHAFDFGLVIGGSINLTARAYREPVRQEGLRAYAPDFMIQIGWAD